MTNMQHYMDDIHDLLEGLNGEMRRRLARIAKWDDQIAEKTVEIEKYETAMFDTSRSQFERSECAKKLAEMRCEIKELAERKTSLSERNHQTVQAVYMKLNELAYHCKCEVEIDNPGCTEQREKIFYESLDVNTTLGIDHQTLLQNLPVSATTTCNRIVREYSVMTDDDRASTRSCTPFNSKERIMKKRPGRPRNTIKLVNFNKFPQNSNGSSARSSVEPDGSINKRKKISKYIRKKQDRYRGREEKITKVDAKKDVDTGDYESYALRQWNNDEDEVSLAQSKVGGAGISAASCGDLCEEDEKELLDCLLSDFDGLPSPPKEIMEALDVTESGLYSMDMYPPDHEKSENNLENQIECRRSGVGASSSQSFTHKRTNNEEATRPHTSFSDSSFTIHSEKQRNTRATRLFGSIADTSFSGRPRKLTDRVTEIIIAGRERSRRNREKEDWCICNGANANSEMMVQCENKSCRIEWFHFDCVGLKSSPKDEWYCPNCRHQSAYSRNSRYH